MKDIIRNFYFKRTGYVHKSKKEPAYPEKAEAAAKRAL